MGFYSRYILPHVLEFAMSRPECMQQRPPALADARGEVLEIGFGTGLNLAHYPASVTHLTVIDPVQMLRKRVAQRLAAAPIPVSVEQADAQALPFDAGRFDCVVSTWTLCSVPLAEETLAEVRRVLKPSGCYLFLEHGLSADQRVARWQDRLDWWHGLVAGGCHVNRPIDRLLSAAGLEITRLERFDLPNIPRYLAPHYRGVAMLA